MEWASGFQSYSDDSLFRVVSSSISRNGGEGNRAVAEWSFEENKLFEDALTEFDYSSPNFFENVASRLPWKSVEDVIIHYQALLEDLELIESGQIPVPEYKDNYINIVKDDDAAAQAATRPQAQPGGKGKPSKSRRRGIPWTEEEHQLFLMGLNRYGKGDWRSISRYYVVTKTATQVASHAQKYFRRQASSTPLERRRPSIHDIQTVNRIPVGPITATTPASIPLNFSTTPASSVLPQLLHGADYRQFTMFEPAGYGYYGVFDPNAVLFPTAAGPSSSASVDPTVNLLLMNGGSGPETANYPATFSEDHMFWG